MRYSILFFLVMSSLSFCMADPKADWQKKRQKVQDTCQKNSKIDPKIVEDIKTNGQFHDPDKKVKDFFYCLEVYHEFIDLQGNLQLETVKKHLKAVGVSDEKINEVTKRCAIKDKVKDTSLMAVAYFQCYARHLPRDVLVI
ncbi:uncharacterized protein LOC123671084 [Harmonia axyridis]|uniref:uncharacterized protein LOC123671084 n=1 Tax=Harmonia axyridis TaxID=115357 RepID=UPI001E27750F|nr:uncharacterized protein LOC123671084 [Harmonia axyridis]